MKDNKKAAYSFLVLLGVISLILGLRLRGCASILGPFLLLLGASAATVGFVSGLGEFIGYAFRLATGFISDKTHRYWAMTIIGYCINLLAIPALALAPGQGWVFACCLIVLERFGKAIRHPAKNTLASFAANEVGAGKGFALQQVMDQFGAFLGPIMLFAVLTLKSGGDKLSAYSLCFLLLGIPGLIVIGLLLAAKIKYPRPSELETSSPPREQSGMGKAYWFYLIGIGLLAAGFADFPLMAFHFAKRQILPDNVVPVLYSVAMAVDAASAFFFGRMFDKRGFGAIIVSSSISAFFAPFAFLTHSPVLAAIGVMLWGVGTGAQESVLKAAVSSMVSKERRGTAFGIFYAGFGALWFLGSWAMGLLYDRSLIALVAFSMVMQFAALPFFFKTKSMIAKARA